MIHYILDEMSYLKKKIENNTFGNEDFKLYRRLSKYFTRHINKNFEFISKLNLDMLYDIVNEYEMLMIFLLILTVFLLIIFYFAVFIFIQVELNAKIEITKNIISLIPF